MQSKVKTTVDSIMLALGPIFHEVKDYETIRLAMVVVMSKIIQATPERGKELEIFDVTSNDILHALEQLLQIEAAERAKLKSTLEAGIEKFGNLVQSDSIGPALVAIEKAVEEEKETIYAFRNPDETLTKAGMEQLTKSVIALHTSDSEHLTLGAQEPALMPSQEDINDVLSAQEEAIRWNEDGPRAYAPKAKEES